jgi:RNA polymerase sigma factor (sigma-70 family)
MGARVQASAATIDFPDASARLALDERRAITAAIAGSRPAFERLYRLHAGRVHALCMRLTGHRETAEDCVQETFISAWRALPRFEARSAFTTWLHRIAVNTVMARHRGLAQSRETGAHEAGAAFESQAAEDAPPLDLEAAIGALPAGARQVLVLVGIYGFTHEEAADALHIAVGTSKAQLHRARQILAARLDLSLEDQ